MSGEIQPPGSPRPPFGSIVSPQCLAAIVRHPLKFERSEHAGIVESDFNSAGLGCQRSVTQANVPPAGTVVRFDDRPVTFSITSRWQHWFIPNPPFRPEKKTPLTVAVMS